MPLPSPSTFPGEELFPGGGRKLTPLAVQMLGEIPPFLREDTHHQAVAYAYAREVERLEGAINTMRAQLVPSEATSLLAVWEATVGAEIEPAGIAPVDRQRIVVAFLRALEADPTGLHWEAVIAFLAGAGWLYIDHIAGNPGTPAANEVHVVLPFAASSFWFGTIKRLVERVTPAHIKLDVTPTGGFLLDESALDRDPL